MDSKQVISLEANKMSESGLNKAKLVNGRQHISVLEMNKKTPSLDGS